MSNTNESAFTALEPQYPLIEGEPVDDLRAILRQLDEEDLRFTIDMLDLRNIDSDALSGEDLVEQTANTLCSLATHEEILINMNPTFREEYLRIMEKGRYTVAEDVTPSNPADHAQFTSVIGAAAAMSVAFAFAHDGLTTFVIPDEVRHAFNRAVEGGILDFCEEVDLVHEYLFAATNLYGAIAVEDLANIMMKLDPQVFAEKRGTLDHILRIVEFDDVLPYFEAEDEEAEEAGKGIVANSLFEESGGLGRELACDLVRFARQVPRFLPTRATLLKYACPDYFEPNFEVELLTELLEGFFPGQADVCAQAISFVQSAAREGIKEDVIIETLAQDILPEPLKNDGQANLLIKQVIKVVNTTRSWGANGHTNQEMEALG